MKNLRIILASASPRRKQLLEQLGWHFEIVRPDADETIFPGEKPELLVERLSQIKGASVAKAHPDALVIASDTVVVSPQGMIFGKPKDAVQAADMLQTLSGCAHIVYSGLALFLNGKCLCDHAGTKVIFRKLSSADIQAYIDGGEWQGKAGAYAIQGRGSLLVDSIEGDYASVVGLPLALLGHLLEGFGITLGQMWEV